MNRMLAIDPEFESKCPPLTEEEFQQLEENILAEGLILMPLIIWNNTIVDGHNRYKIAQSHPGVEFRNHEKQFDNRYEAISWICKNQLGRRNLTPQQRRFLIGEQYAAEKMAYGASDGFRGNQHSNLVRGPNCPLPEDHKTRKQVAEATGTSESYDKCADQYARGVNAAEEVLPGIKDELLSGKIKPSDADVAAVAKAPQEERRERAEKLRLPKERPKSPPKRVSPKMNPILQKSYEEMLAPKPKVDEKSILHSIECAVEDFLRLCCRLEGLFPRLRSDVEYRAKFITAVQQIEEYLNELKEYEEND